MSTTTDVIQINSIDAETIRVPLLGTAPYIMHRFSEKQRRMMLDGMQGKKTPRQPKNPAAEYDAAFYRLGDGTAGIPVIAFKAATIGAARFYHGLTMTSLRQFIFVRGEIGSDGQQLTRVDGEPRMREDVVRVARGGTDLRYRAEFPAWKVKLDVVYITSALTRDSVLSLIDAGGMGIGVGEWRPENRGEFGTYRIDPDEKVEIL